VLPGAQTRDGFVGLVVSCELEQPALQKLLYDLEAGMPFLFIDQLETRPLPRARPRMLAQADDAGPAPPVLAFRAAFDAEERRVGRALSVPFRGRPADARNLSRRASD
jgi:hypothetical protein